MAATAVRVFGKPITQGTRTQRAQAAKNYQNADGKYDQVTQATIYSQKAAAGGANTATVSTTLGRVYNATGDPLTYVIAHDWQGSVVGQYPMKIQNGQWAIFEHVGTSGANRQGSVAAVVFNIQDCSDSLIAWNNPWKTATSGNNTAYCEMNHMGYYNDSTDWDAIFKKLTASETETQTSLQGYATKVNIEAGNNNPIYTAVFCLDV
ncbi:hypothetical protein M8C21_024389 [Ambrosia artemisiifolia]|uniref:Uncharacterized protein n=1 Tax=Ambrosia artemisiifolia TaxID=4212 RepID=A0AAD5CAV2_AMBAR|nr:hypothetical protein M8C21_024389 [Ambrosia artemisiifolia]